MTKMKSFWNNLPQPFFALAPMEAVTDVVFRHVVQRAGAPDVFFTEFANATGWVHAGDKAIAGRLFKTDDEHPLVAQIWGGEPGDMEQFSAHCARLGFDGIDINMGCPAKSAIKSGGAALIRRPDVAVAAIHAAKTAGLPVSVKTRLGYTHVDEWREWLQILLEQNIVNLTIHLRTKKEMSKVPAHYELIDDIVALRDAVAPHTLLTINGDIRDREHGLALASEHSGVNGIMIGRGVFANPFCFAANDTGCLHSQNNLEQNKAISIDDDSVTARYTELFNLLNYHLDLFDRYQPQTERPFETLKRFFKIYVKGFDGAKELRDQLMHATSTDEARNFIKNTRYAI